MKLYSFQSHKTLKLKIVLRYALLQVPEFILIIIGLYVIRTWFDLSDWLFWAIILIMVIKDILLFPFLWPAYDWDNPKNTNPLLGRRGVARERLAPKGYIFINGELWMAEGDDEDTMIEKNEAVIVTGVQGLTLFVRPVIENGGREERNREKGK